MKYSEEFKELVKNGVSKKYFVGTGNPNSKIVFIGKESAIAESDIIGRQWYNDNAKSWQKHINNETCESLCYKVDENHIFRKNRIWGKNTWSKYQKFHDFIFMKENTPNYIDFLKNVFTTEINDSPEKNTANADKSSLNERKEMFKESKYIQNFSVVVLACSDYIKNNDNVREIDDIFDVTFDNHALDKYSYSKGNRFFTHHNKDKSKLVIHTRQLSGNVNNDMLEEMGKIIRQHLVKMGEIK